MLGLESLRVGGKFLLVGLELGLRRGQFLLLLHEGLLAGGNFLVALEMIGLLVGDFGLFSRELGLRMLDRIALLRQAAFVGLKLGLGIGDLSFTLGNLFLGLLVRYRRFAAGSGRVRS